jgi:hypothetical protein
LKIFSKTLHFSHHICGVCVKACHGRRTPRKEQSA